MSIAFDPWRELHDIREQADPHATVAKVATRAEPTPETVARIAGVAGHPEPHERPPALPVAGVAAGTVDEWEERAAIREHDAGQGREEAERAAAADLGGDVVDFRAAARWLREGNK